MTFKSKKLKADPVAQPNAKHTAIKEEATSFSESSTALENVKNVNFKYVNNETVFNH